MAEHNYDAQVAELVRYYKQAVERIKSQLDRFDLTDLTRANQLATLKAIGDILKSLNEDAAKWAADNIPMAARDGWPTQSWR
jgi:hypothetical protein